MGSKRRHRRAVRFDIDQPALLREERGEWFGGVLRNYGEGGLYFEAGVPQTVGAVLRICTEATMAAGMAGRSCLAVVRWVRPPAPKSGHHGYGAGAEIGDGWMPWDSPWPMPARAGEARPMEDGPDGGSRPASHLGSKGDGI
jgi:hypothetical protein